MAKNAPNVFKKNLRVFIDLANDLKIADALIADFYSLPLINGDRELVCAIALQNLMHPKNSHRREAVASKSYCLLRNNGEANAYLRMMLVNNFKMELSGRQSAIRDDYIKQASASSGTYFLSAPDINYSAAVLLQEGFLIGNGGRTELIYLI